MKKILLILILPLLLISCSSNSADDYQIVSSQKVDGYYILEKVQKGLKFFFHLKGRACAEDTCSD